MKAQRNNNERSLHGTWFSTKENKMCICQFKTQWEHSIIILLFLKWVQFLIPLFTCSFDVTKFYLIKFASHPSEWWVMNKHCFIIQLCLALLSFTCRHCSEKHAICRSPAQSLLLQFSFFIYGNLHARMKPSIAITTAGPWTSFLTIRDLTPSTKPKVGRTGLFLCAQ